MRWLDGVYQGIGWDSELVEAQFPKLPMVAQAAPVTSFPVRVRASLPSTLGLSPNPRLARVPLPMSTSVNTGH